MQHTQFERRPVGRTHVLTMDLTALEKSMNAVLHGAYARLVGDRARMAKLAEIYTATQQIVALFVIYIPHDNPEHSAFSLPQPFRLLLLPVKYGV